MNPLTAQSAHLNTPKAIALLSGGLDSALAAALVKSWGIEVIGLHLTSPFGCETHAEKVAKELNISLITQAKGEAFIDLVSAPTYGYGSQMNPCVDCRIYMFQIAEKVLKEQKADFIVTGEVVGQRPLSQNKANIQLIERKSPLERLVVRPLSGGNLPPTLAEEKGWILRSCLLKISGRGRTEQLALAKQLGISAFSSPGGGCLLTETAFSDRLKDFFSHPTYANSEEKESQAQMLRLGRHFRIHSNLKVIVARTDSENAELLSHWEQSGAQLVEPVNYKGPIAVSLGTLCKDDKTTIAKLLSKYGRKNDEGPFLTRFKSHNSTLQPQEDELISTTEKLAESIIEHWRIGIT
ncbi:MAG: hypothetical protein ACKOA8_07815 [Deltaproteobacteria bacterium]